MRYAVSHALRGVLVVSVLVGGAFGTSGCKKLVKKGADLDAGAAPSAKQASAATTSEDAKDEQLQEKLAAYIGCLNTLSSPIHQARRRYAGYVPKAGPTGRETFAAVDALPNGAASTCTTGTAKAKAMPPSDPKLESTGEEFAASSSELDSLLTDAHRYFDNKDFRDDKWAKGKALHPKLMAAWSRFSKADKALHDTLDGITKPLAQRSLARIEREEGQKFRYHRKHALIAGRELVEAADPVGEDDSIDFALYQSAFAEFEKALDDLSTYGASHKAELENQKLAPSWPLAVSHFASFTTAGTAYRKSAKDFLRCLRDAPASAKNKAGKIDVQKVRSCPDGKPEKVAEEVVDKFNAFIRTSNNNQFP